MARIIDGVRCNITGECIKEARQKAGFSQKELSEVLETKAENEQLPILMRLLKS